MSSEIDVVEPVDAVFVIGTGSKNKNEELKYALRNLERNCPFIRDVYISGECPGWVDKTVVKHLQWPDRFTHAKDANIIDKLRHACEHEGIAKNILFCSDDQFQTAPCTWADFEARWLRRYSPNDRWYADRKRIWHNRLRSTLERDRQRRIAAGLNPDDVFYYQPHIWMPIDRDKFVEYAKWSDYEHRDDTIIASGYFNFIDAGGKSNFDHIFITAAQRWPVKERHVAYTDSSFSAAMQYLRREFSIPSRFEASKAEHPEKRSDEDILSELISKISSEPVWSDLAAEVAEAESLRKGKIVGWRKVWNDIIRRWTKDTYAGRHVVKVTTPRSYEASSVLESVKAARAETGKGATSAPKRKCSKCEERRRRAEEARKARMEAEKAEKEKPEPAGAKAPEPLNEDAKAEPFDACVDCAIEHLSTAVAYLNSNAGRPAEFEHELAKGEVSVAMQHLLALNMDVEYNRCLEALDSVYSPETTFTAAGLKSILKSVVESRSKGD